MTQKLFIKTARDAVGIERLAHEAAIVRLAAHPRVVPILSQLSTGNAFALGYERITPLPLSAGTSSLPRFARIFADVAATIAFLHERGIVHGRIDTSHVLLRKNTMTPVICGFGKAVLTHAPGAQRTDVVALGHLLHASLPARAELVRLRATGEREWVLYRELQRIAAASVYDSSMSARRFAEQVRSAVDGMKRPVRRPHSRVGVFSTAGALLLILTGAAQLAYTPSPPTTAASTTKTTCPPPQGDGDPLDVDGDGCDEHVALHGTIVSIDNERYAVGKPGDQLFIGDWKCDREKTLALVRLSTGEVFVFDNWPADGQAEQPRLVGVVERATGAAIARQDACDIIAMETPSGVTPVDPRKATS